MKRHKLAFGFILAFQWVLMILLGAILFETFILYPNIFRDIPRSFEVGMQFMVKGPSDFFPPVGMLAIVTGIIAVLLSWKIKSVRYWILSSLVIIFIGEFLFSMLFFWPRNTIMFEQGTAVYTIAYLKQVAYEFQTGHWIRVLMSTMASLFSYIGLFKFFRNKK